MTIVNMIKNAMRVRATEAELSRMTDRELHDIGIHRADIARVARESVYGT